MCEYCNNQIKNKKIKDIDNDKEDWIEVIYQKIHGNMIYVELDGIDNDGYKTIDFFEINYCPICGRNLKNDKNVKSSNNHSLNKLKAEVDRLKKITNKLEEENELRKKHLAGQAHKLITDMRIYEDAIEYRQKFWEELDRQKMLDLFKKRRKMLDLFEKEKK